MVTIVGFVVVIGSILVGFMMAGGKLMALVHPSEIVSIGGAALGALIVMSPTKVLKGVVGSLMQCIKGTPFNKQTYEDLFKLLYDLLRVAQRA